MTRWRRPAVLLLLLAGLALAATFSRPTLRLKSPVYRYVFVFDITASMHAEDLSLDGKPVSRLDYAKHVTLDALKALPCGSEAGLAGQQAEKSEIGGVGHCCVQVNNELIVSPL